jgi:hypothetical protein
VVSSVTGDSHGGNKEVPITEGIAAAQSEQLQRGREALQRHAWEEAFDALSGAAASGPVPAEDLEALAEAAYWTAHFDAELSALEAAYGVYIDAGSHCRAAYIALQLATAHATKGAEAVARGWHSRAERLLQNQPECAVHGYLAAHHWWSVFWGQLDFERAQTFAERAAEIGDKYGDRDLWALATHGVGWSLLMQGAIDRALALIDESAAAAVGGEVSPRTAGDIYCWRGTTGRSVPSLRSIMAGKWITRVTVFSSPSRTQQARSPAPLPSSAVSPSIDVSMASHREYGSASTWPRPSRRAAPTRAKESTKLLESPRSPREARS